MDMFWLPEIWSSLSYLHICSKCGSFNPVVKTVTFTCTYGSMPTQFHRETPTLIRTWPPWWGLLSFRRCTVLWSWSLIAFNRSTRCGSWLRHRAASQMVSCSILDGVTASGCTVTLGSTQPRTEMSTRKISCWVKAAARRADNVTTLICRLAWNPGAPTSWNPQGLSRPVQGLLYLSKYREILPKHELKQLGFQFEKAFATNFLTILKFILKVPTLRPSLCLHINQCFVSRVQLCHFIVATDWGQPCALPEPPSS